MKERIYLYDSTLRDGGQTNGINFTSVDKQDIAVKLDRLGIDYIEGGWPGSNPTDDIFFKNLPDVKTSKIVAFGMTRRISTSVQNDSGIANLINSGVSSICIVGKSWDFHVKKALEISLEDNLKLISQSVEHIVSKNCEVIFDAEHFFDGFKANPEHALNAIKSAIDAGARWAVLCDTNGSTLPHEIEAITLQVTKEISGEKLGIHCHNDTGNAVANSIAAVRAGVRQVQGTINGIGERCGNANLVTLIPTLKLKMGYDVGISDEKLKNLTKTARFLDDKLNNQYAEFSPYVGTSAFAHKGGLHVSAVAKDPTSYEHINPEKVGNKRAILVSDQAGASNILQRLNEIGFDVSEHSKADIAKLVEIVKSREANGYSYDNADASFELLARRTLGRVPKYYELIMFRTFNIRTGDNADTSSQTEATIKIKVNDKEILTVAEGNGPINAIDKSLRRALSPIYSSLTKIRLVDFKVRIVNANASTGAVTRVLIESANDTGKRWTTIGVSENIIDASYNALRDSINYSLLKE